MTAMAKSLPTPTCVVLLLLLGAAGTAQAQGRAPATVAVPAEARAAVPPLPDIARDATRALGPPLDPLARGLAGVRIGEAQALVRANRGLLDTDRHGAPVIRSQVIAIDPSEDALARARQAGFAVAGEHRLDGLDLRIVVLHARPGMGTRAALRRLRRLDPAGSYDFNHLYFGSGDTAIPAVPPTGTVSDNAVPLRVGLVDSGVDARHPALAGVEMRRWGCGGQAHPARHGTAVASLLAGTAVDAPATGSLYAADIYCGQPTGGNALQLAEALAWLAREQVGVINLSLVGPDNRLLAESVRAMIRRGHVIVAAVGNDGPNAPPLYPAAYPDVIGVTAVDRRLRLLPEAVRGPQVRFAAPGAGLRAAQPDGGWSEVRGTSYAAPLVARLAALQVPVPVPDATETVVMRLQTLASLPARGGRNGFGLGVLGTQLVGDYADADADAQAAR